MVLIDDDPCTGLPSPNAVFSPDGGAASDYPDRTCNRHWILPGLHTWYAGSVGRGNSWPNRFRSVNLLGRERNKLAQPTKWSRLLHDGVGRSGICVRGRGPISKVKALREPDPVATSRRPDGRRRGTDGGRLASMPVLTLPAVAPRRRAVHVLREPLTIILKFSKLLNPSGR
jgi:hypothetical protein